MLSYNAQKPELEQWSFTETSFNPLAQGKCESVMSLGNGYMGLRSATEEAYVGGTRNLFVNGTFNRFDDLEVTELPNAADVTQIEMLIDGRRFSLETGDVTEYARTLNLRDAELTRSFVWRSPDGKRIRFEFSRFVSMDDLHLIGMKLRMTPLDEGIALRLASGINAQVANSGSQHFHEGEKRIFDKKYLQLVQTTTESKVDFVLSALHRFRIDEVPFEPEPQMEIERRKMEMAYRFDVKAGQALEMHKFVQVHTSRDADIEAAGDLKNLRAHSLEALQKAEEAGYERLFERHRQAWADIWQRHRFDIESESPFDLLALRFAIYHLTIMTPAHDRRMGIGAKGLSGEGYKGHSFWDTEIFILPFFIYSDPKVARTLLEYRYLGLEGARKKAKENGFQGAMYPWEVAWPSDGEATPVWGAVDVVTGKQTKIWSGFIEQHITADIAYAVWHYYRASGDQRFMDDYGYEMIFDTAVFWTSRLEWNEAASRYEINGVIGPDEYKEHVDNNAFTNYMAHFNLQLAIQYYDELKNRDPQLLKRLESKLGLERGPEEWREKADALYLPQPDERGIIAQDDTYLQKQELDLTPYKSQAKVGTLFQDYSLDQVNEMQVSKQADILMLFYLLENRFAPELKRANYDYYEPKTLHDSSLSFSTHSILASDFDDKKLAYELFHRAAEIDLGPHEHSSDAGIHAASLGGIWQCVVMGFAGVRMLDGMLHVHPKMPDAWERLSFPLFWKGTKLQFNITKDEMEILADTQEVIELVIYGQKMSFQGRLQFERMHI